MNFLGNNIMVYVTVLSPVWAYVLYHIPRNSRWFYGLTGVGLLAPIVYTSINPFVVHGVSLWLNYYFFFLMVYLLLFGFKKNYNEFWKVLAFSLMSLFVAGDLWELPIFLYDFMGKMKWIVNPWNYSVFDMAWMVSHIRRLYTLSVFILLSKISGLTLNRRNGAILLLATFTSFVLLLPLGLNVHLLANPLAVLTRIMYMSLFGAFIYIGLSEENTIV